MRTFVAMLASACLVLGGCATFQGVPVPRQANERADVKVGETAEVTTRDGAKRQFKVSEVTDDALVGQGVRVAYADMTSLQVNRSDPSQTGVALYVVGGILVAVLVGYIVAHESEVASAGSARR